MHYSKRIERSAEKRAFIMKKKLLSVVLTAVMAATVLTGCGSTDNGTASTTAGSAAQTEAATSTDGKVYNIGICQLVEHEALDAATQGFQDALKEKLGDNVKFDLQNRCLNGNLSDTSSQLGNGTTEEVTESNTKCRKCKSHHILVRSECDRQKTVDQPAQGRCDQGTQQ